jgi:hypothetical protein
MEKFIHPNYSALLETLGKKQLVVVGEMHGINENAAVVQALLTEFLKRGQQVCLAFEWLLSNEELETLQGYLSGEELTGAIPSFFLDSDGRFTPAHVALLEYARAHNQQHEHKVSIAIFDTNEPEREWVMANQLEQISRNYDGYVLAEMGVVHARRSGEGSLIDILSASMPIYTFFITYQEGTVAVDGEIYSVLDSAEQQRGPAEHFDAVITIVKANHFEEASLLTMLQRFYKV